MPPVITESERGVDGRGVSPPPWATEPPVWGEPVKGEPAGWDKVRRDLAEMERKKVFRYARPDGSQLETTWVNESSAKVWAEMNGLRYLGRVPDRTETPAPPPPDFGDGEPSYRAAPEPSAVGEGRAAATGTSSEAEGEEEEGGASAAGVRNLARRSGPRRRRHRPRSTGSSIT